MDIVDQVLHKEVYAIVSMKASFFLRLLTSQALVCFLLHLLQDILCLLLRTSSRPGLQHRDQSSPYHCILQSGGEQDCKVVYR